MTFRAYQTSRYRCAHLYSIYPGICFPVGRGIH
jgi:hypothetical protein